MNARPMLASLQAEATGEGTAIGSRFDSRELRAALGVFATGVTVITTRSPEGQLAGITANSFSSVSLDPPLVLWSLGRRSFSLQSFQAASHWAVHVLAADQQWLADRFARSHQNKFADLALNYGLGGVPLLPDCAARLQCRSHQRIDGGDHVIFLGQVESVEHIDDVPTLMFHRGRYTSAG